MARLYTKTVSYHIYLRISHTTIREIRDCGVSTLSLLSYISIDANENKVHRNTDRGKEIFLIIVDISTLFPDPMDKIDEQLSSYSTFGKAAASSQISELPQAALEKSSPVDTFLERQNLSITASLETALKAIREADYSVLLSIDQICINQHDPKEKSSQIPLMKDIDSLSAQTIGWLGESTADSDLAMDYLWDVSSQAIALSLGNI